MAIILPSGFNITNNDPVDARFSLADQAARYGLSSANIYEGLVVYQRDNNTLWILVDTTEVSNSNGWQQVTSSELSDTITGRLDNLEITSASHDSRLDQLETDSGSQAGRLDSIESFTSSIDTTIKTKLDIEGVISGSDQLSGSLVTLDTDQTISGTKTFNDIVVNGTGSFAYIESVTGSAKIIGDAYIVLNNNTPSERFAGIQIYDSGSAGVTASLEFDGQTNDWFYEYSDDNGVTTEHGVVLFGAEYSTKGNPTYPTNNIIQKGNGGHHLLDSNISDNGTTITLNSNVQVNGNISITGSVDGIDLQNFSSSVDGRLDTLEGTSNENPLTFSDTTTIDFTRVGDTITADVIGGIVSGSSQLTLGGDVTGTANANTVEKIQGISITSGEATQLANINTTSISTTQWGYVGALDQGLTTNSEVQFSKLGVGGASDATYELKVTGDIGATGDVVAYISSDRRLKDEITPIENSLQKINQIGGYSFVWNEKQDIYKGKDYGVIAQEIEEILPELVETRENGYKAVKYNKLVSLLIEGIKELTNEVTDLKKNLEK